MAGPGGRPRGAIAGARRPGPPASLGLTSAITPAITPAFFPDPRKIAERKNARTHYRNVSRAAGPAKRGGATDMRRARHAALTDAEALRAD